LTNILRDVSEDAAQGRVYLPLEDLARFGYSESELLRGVYDTRFQRLMAFQIQRAEHYYAEADKLHAHLDRSGRRVFGTMVSTYRQILEMIKGRDADGFGSPVRLSRMSKLKILARWALPCTL
jgi:phytoene synthase